MFGVRLWRTVLALIIVTRDVLLGRFLFSI